MESNLRVLESLYGVSILDEDNSLDGSVSGSGDLSKDYSGGDSDEGLEGGSDYTDTTITGIEDNSSGSEDYASGDEADISGSGDQPSVTVEGSVGGSTDSEEVAKILNLFSDSDE
jgi:hypothetical protein